MGTGLSLCVAGFRGRAVVISGNTEVKVGPGSGLSASSGKGESVVTCHSTVGVPCGSHRSHREAWTVVASKSYRRRCLTHIFRCAHLQFTDVPLRRLSVTPRNSLGSSVHILQMRKPRSVTQQTWELTVKLILLMTPVSSSAEESVLTDMDGVDMDSKSI